MYIITSFLPNERNGVSKSLRLLLKRLNKRTETIIVLTSKSLPLGFDYKEFSNCSFEFIPIGISNIFKPLLYYRNIKRYYNLIKSIRYNKIICICWHTSLTNLLSLFSHKIHKSVDLYIYSHGTNSTIGAIPFSAKSILQIFFHYLYRITLMPKMLDRCNFLYALSNTYNSCRIDDIKYLLNSNPSKIVLTSNENNKESKFYPRIDDLNISPTFIVACRPTKQKGLQYLKSLLLKISKIANSSNVKFLLCLPIEKNQINNKLIDELTSNKNINKILNIKYNCDEKDLEKLYSKSSIYYISLSRCEYEPYGIIEPLSMGVPSFAYPAGGIKHLYGVNIYDTVNELAFYIKSIIYIPSYRERLRLSGQVAKYFLLNRATISNIL